jgi:altronate hydrolase
MGLVRHVHYRIIACSNARKIVPWRTNIAVMNKVLRIHPSDNVLVALSDIAAGETVFFEGVSIRAAEPVPMKHKMAIETLRNGEAIVMYGVLVGRATRPISAGARISTQNTAHAASAYAGKQENTAWRAPDVGRWRDRTFMGYHRENGCVGVANYWLVVPLVFCENRNLEVIRAALLEELGYAPPRAFAVNTRALVDSYLRGAGKEQLLALDILENSDQYGAGRLFPNVDGIKFLKHEGGCGGTREDSETLCRLLAGYIDHPNVAGATVLSLGCQHAQTIMLREALQGRNPAFNKPLYILEQQKSRSERHFIAEAVQRTFVGLVEANEARRRAAPLSALCVGLECGGSDGFSGITANPALGHASDLLTALGATTILSEFPELNGVEQELLNRCVDEAGAGKFARLMKAYAQRAEAVGSGFAYNPSPGNIRDGLITDAIKSAGAARKGGTSPVVDVLDYTEPALKPGLNLLCTPGNDVESTTGLAGSGANLIVFTTGLGTPTGNPVAPTIKVATNSELARRMPDIIDIDAGTILTGQDSIESKGEEILEFLIAAASGSVVPHAVRLQQDDFIPWKRGVSL